MVMECAVMRCTGVVIYSVVWRGIFWHDVLWSSVMSSVDCVIQTAALVAGCLMNTLDCQSAPHQCLMLHRGCEGLQCGAQTSQSCGQLAKADTLELAVRRMRRPESVAASLLMMLSALPHLPASIRLHCTIGVSEQGRDFWRTMDVFMIFTCAGMPAACPLLLVTSCMHAVWWPRGGQAGRRVGESVRVRANTHACGSVWKCM